MASLVREGREEYGRDLMSCGAWSIVRKRGSLCVRRTQVCNVLRNWGCLWDSQMREPSSLIAQSGNTSLSR